MQVKKQQLEPDIEYVNAVYCHPAYLPYTQYIVGNAGLEKARGFPEKLLLLHWLHWRLCVDHIKLWKILKEMIVSGHLTCHLRELYAGQEIVVIIRYGTMNPLQIGKGVWQGCILSPCLFNFYTEYTMWISGLDEAQTGIKIAGRNISNLRYADDITLMAESEEELERLLMRVKKLAWNSTFKKWRSWHLVPSLYGK